jgi:hypothetical protein
MRSRVLLAVVLVGTLLMTSCGGAEERPPPEAGALEELRTEVAQTYESGALEALLNEALAIATRNAGSPLGQEAFDFAEQTVIDRYAGHEAGPFSGRIPAPPDQIADSYVQDFRNLAAFVAVAPEPYRPVAVLERFQKNMFERADRTLRDLEWARNNRADWAAELAAEGATEATWFALVATLDSGMKASMGSIDSEQYAFEHARLLYTREMAVIALQPADLLAAWDLVIAAVLVANFEPPNLDTRYEDGTFITRYTEEAMAAGAANARELTDAIESARVFFPPIVD